MGKLIFFIFVVTLFKSFSQTKGTFTDSRNGKVYQTVVIGNQTWFAENLNVSAFRNGDPIPEAKTSEEWIQAFENKQPAWCYYDNDPVNGKIYGKLYNWHAINDPRGLAPDGWHISSLDDWNYIKSVIEFELPYSMGKKIKSQNGWKNQGNGTDTYFFNGLPGGIYRFDINNHLIFSGLNSNTEFWSSTDFYVDLVYSKQYCVHFVCLSSENEDLLWTFEEPKTGKYVRCLKD
jgi:uncharacterized protein (TIGR02145 family)